MSCGAPNAAAMRSPSSQIAASSAGETLRASRRSAGSATCSVPAPPAARTMARSFLPIVAARSPPARDQTNSSASQAPPTTPSPRPKVALTSASSRSPLTGFDVKSTPETWPSIIRCTTTATRGSATTAPPCS